MKDRSALVSLALGAIVFTYPAYLLLDRRAAGETVMWMEPDVVRPGQASDAVWSYKAYRNGCRGLVHRVHIDSQGHHFDYDAIDAAIHGPIGVTELHRFEWVIPGMAPGPAIFRRQTDRWCNWLQRLWPMQEVHEAKYTVLPP